VVAVSDYCLLFETPGLRQLRHEMLSLRPADMPQVCYQYLFGLQADNLRSLSHQMSVMQS